MSRHFPFGQNTQFRQAHQVDPEDILRAFFGTSGFNGRTTFHFEQRRPNPPPPPRAPPRRNPVRNQSISAQIAEVLEHIDWRLFLPLLPVVMVFLLFLFTYLSAFLIRNVWYFMPLFFVPRKYRPRALVLCLILIMLSRK
eukprot:NODE_8423_length_680_cov_32.274686_g7801_i0.p1 GENE.NODE_8423_length_680_cov_32.274686_g7801_i0~~NODE_8423_length_680_cov_32.274686_g7801_i0.p1  ORF type:complete len:140 (+),score=11.48 NODE_8423_length_680_cov_32.274686_g7801_i0:240-659(+)